MKKIFALFLVLFIFSSSLGIYSERWVGRAASYQLLDGSVTRNGDQFDANAFTAACNGYNLGARVAITNVQTGKQIIVRVNDRIDQNSEYFILLSPAAAREIGMLWDTGLVVVDAGFSDLNSSEILAVNGLLPEGRIDDETLKTFPQVNWGTLDSAINSLVNERDINTNNTNQSNTTEQVTTQTPIRQDNVVPDHLNTVNNMGSDNGSFRTWLERVNTNNSTTENSLLTPQGDTMRIPERRISNNDMITVDAHDARTFQRFSEPEHSAMNVPEKTYVSDMVGDDSGEYRRFGTAIEPVYSYNSIPERGGVNEQIGIDYLAYRTFENFVEPRYEALRIPQRLNNSDNLSVDFQNIDNPVSERIETPESIVKNELLGLDTDVREPFVRNFLTPERRVIIQEIGSDIDTNNPLSQRVVNPENLRVVENIGGDLDKDYPISQRVFNPQNQNFTENIGGDMNEYPNNESIVNPNRESNQNTIGTDYDSNHINRGIEWLSNLDSSRAYIKFSTSFNRIEGERRYNLFKQVFSDLIAYKSGNRYILLISPEDQSRLSSLLEGVRAFGYTDAYIIN